MAVVNRSVAGSERQTTAFARKSVIGSDLARRVVSIAVPECRISDWAGSVSGWESYFRFAASSIPAVILVETNSRSVARTSLTHCSKNPLVFWGFHVSVFNLSLALRRSIVSNPSPKEAYVSSSCGRYLSAAPLALYRS